MKFLSTPDDLQAEFRRLTRSYRHFDWAVAWASAGHTAFYSLDKFRAKIRRIVVGTHFHQTSPDFIDAFAGVTEVRFRLDQDGLNGVFHPKLYLFTNSETDWEAVVGSANFTAGAFGRNIEHAVVIGSGDEIVGVTHAELIDEIDQLWQKGRHFAREELAAYRLRWAKNKKMLDRVAGHDSDQKRRESIYDRKLLSLSWTDYLGALRDKKEKYFENRLQVLRAAKVIWENEPSFAKLIVEDRKKICGTASEKDIRWRLFGSMKGALKFKAALRDKNKYLLKSLDEIPLRGEVRVSHYKAYIGALSWAFDQIKEFGGLAVATRLLCMRRPDYFVCVDSKNRLGLYKMLGISERDVTVESYWETVVEPLLDTPWWQSERPSGDKDEETIWDGRVAMVDALFYEGQG